MRIAAIVAHPDDEIIGVGGTLRKHIENGDEVFVYVMCEGKSSRYDSYSHFENSNKIVDISETISALNCIGIGQNQFKCMHLKNNRLDGMELLDIIKVLEKQVLPFNPNIIYTHYYNDLNIDHQLIARAVVTQFRALPLAEIKEIICFETLSSTENTCSIAKAFCPNLFVDITEQLDIKLAAMACYKSELRELPHPRSLEAIRGQAILEGAKVGLYAAESFVISRIIR